MASPQIIEALVAFVAVRHSRSVHVANRPALWLATLILAAASVAFAAGAYDALTIGDQPAAGAVMVVLGVVAAAASGRFPMLGAWVTEHEVIVRQSLRTIRVPIDQVLDCRMDGDGGRATPRLVRRSGEKILLPGIGRAGLLPERLTNDQRYGARLAELNRLVRERINDGRRPLPPP